MALRINHPEVYHRDCSRCLKYHYDETGKESVRNGKPVERAPRTYAPCRKPSGSECPKGSPEQPNTLTPRNEMAWRFYQACKLTGRWPEDHWSLDLYVRLDEVVRQCEEVKATRERTAEMELIIAVMGARR